MGAHLVGVEGRQLLQQPLLVLGELGGDLDLDPGQQVPGATPIGGEAAALDPEDLAAGGTVRDPHLDRSVHGRHVELGAEGGLREADGHRHREVVVAAPEDPVGGHVHLDQQVPGGAPVAARTALAGQPDGGPVLDPGGDAHLHRAGAHLDSRAPALGARVFDDDPRPPALRARFAEREQSLVACHRAGAAAGRAGLGPGRRLGSGAAAVGTRGLAPDLDAGGDPLEGLLERDGEIGAAVGPA